VLKVLAGALLIVAVAALIIARWSGFKHDTSHWWLVGVGVSAACILLAVALLRLDARRSGRKTTQ
jgi:4-amino-4-deoxy-L-arabinose transferase-like glycosyltransferase